MTVVHSWLMPGAAAALLAGAILAASTTACAAAETTVLPFPEPDPHYTAMGFFDVRQCHWPDQQPFLQALFSTTRFDAIRSVEVFDPGGSSIGRLDFAKYRSVKQKDGGEKRVFITAFPMPREMRDGWFRALVTTADGTIYQARDYVEAKMLPIARNVSPLPGAENIAPPGHLSWDAVPGATHYQVFVWDLWNPEQPIFSSLPIAESRIALPGGLIRPGGNYTWRVHARDVNGHVELGDFNHGSLTPYLEFGIRP